MRGPLKQTRPPPIHAVIIAGGAGERFWPASRARRPKPFLEVVDGRTLLDATLRRARRFAAPGGVWAVCGRDHAPAIRRAARLPAARVLVEPQRRNTAMAVGLAAAWIGRDAPDAVLAILPADHVIPDAGAFAAAVRRAAVAARQAGVLVTLGVRPTRPDTGYGYIQAGLPAGRSHPGLRRVRRFVEKPDAARARRYLRQGGYLWNAGIFVFTARTMLEEIARCAPDLAAALEPIGRPGARGGRRLARCYRAAPSLPVDVAVMGRSRRVWTLPVDFHWSDVGTFASLAEELGVSDGQTRVLGGELLFDEQRGNLVWGGRRAVALLGVEGVAVVDTDDVLLITKLERSPDVRRIVAELKARGRVDVL